MYLATSSLDQYWEKNNKILFIGEWCISENSVLNGLDYELMPYHWNSESNMVDDMNYIYSKYVEIIPQLSKHLNKINNKEFSIKYWHFLIGPWLFKFLNVLFDRFKSLEKATELETNLETVIFSNSFIPETFLSFYELCMNDAYNHSLYGDIIKNSNLKINYNEVDSNLSTDLKKLCNKKKINNSKKNNPRNYRRLISNFLSPNKRESLLRKILDFYKSDCDVQILTSGFKVEDLRSFYKVLNHKFNPQINNTILRIPSHTSTNKEYRSNLDIYIDDDQFTRIAKKLIMQHIPKEYLEYFSEWRSLSKSESCHYFQTPKAIILRSPFEGQSIIRYYCAEKWENGSKIISMQHGGGYGVQTFKGIDEVEAGLCDLYLTWGWNSYLKNVKPFFLTKTHWIVDYNYNKKGEIILLGSSLRKFFEDSTSQPPSFNNIHLDFNTRLIKRLSDEMKKKLIYRFHNDRGFRDQEKIKTLFPDIRTSSRTEEGDFYSLFYNSSIIIATSNHTSFLQSFAVNHPTLILWPEDFNLLPKSVSHYYDLLKEAEILYNNPEDCADKLNDIKNNPMEWWLKNDVQNAKNKFCENIFKYSENIGYKLGHIVKNLIK